jgi:endoglucanase
MKKWLVSLACLMVLSQTALAIDLKRGLPTDTWVTWPSEREWSEAGFLKTYPEWRKTYGPQDLANAKVAGFDFIRLGLDPAPFIHQPSPAKTALMIKGMNATIAEILASGLNVVVDIHTIPVSGRAVGTESYLANAKSFNRYLSLISMLGQALATQDPARVAFEPINEPTIDCSWETTSAARWPAMAVKLHATARRAAPKLPIIIHGGCWGGSDGLIKLKPSAFRDPNIIWSFHSYAPFLLTHQGASWTDGSTKYMSGLRYPPVPADQARILEESLARVAAADLTPARKEELSAEIKRDINNFFTPGFIENEMSQPFRDVSTWTKINKIPADHILLGEFGVIKADLAAITPDEIRAPIIEATRKYAESYGYAWSIWHWGGSFGITNEETKREFTPIIMQALGMKKP